jgi:hypothetical protein
MHPGSGGRRAGSGPNSARKAARAQAGETRSLCDFAGLPFAPAEERWTFSHYGTLFAHDVDYSGPPFRWDPERRFLLRCEIDAAFFHLYGISRDDAAYILDTFPIVKKSDEKAHGEYRTQRVILEIYDAMADAARTGKPYQTRLDPPPADARVAHPDTRKAAVQGKTKGRA